jgi:hypothetical protein
MNPPEPHPVPIAAPPPLPGRPTKMPKAVRRTLWMLYAAPFSLLVVVATVMELNKRELWSAVDMVVSFPSWVALHLHIWDKRFLSAMFWRPYAFGAVIWDVIYNVYIDHPKEPQSRWIYLVILIFIPLYIALFRYAFRQWDDRVAR